MVSTTNVYLPGAEDLFERCGFTVQEESRAGASDEPGGLDETDGGSRLRAWDDAIRENLRFSTKDGNDEDFPTTDTETATDRDSAFARWETINLKFSDGGNQFKWIDLNDFRRFFKDNPFPNEQDDKPDDPSDDPVAEQPDDPVQEPEPEVDPEPEAEQDPEPEPEPQAEQDPEPEPEPEQPADPGQNAGAGSDGFGAFEQEVIRLTNEARTQNGLAALTADDRLNRAAEGHSDDMAKLDFFSHTGQDGSSAGDRMEDEGYDWRTWGENIAAGQDTPQQVVDGWLNSPGHRTNILNANFEDIGVGFVEDEGDGYGEYWTQVFAA